MTLLVGGALGAVFFLVVLGTWMLDPTSIGWVMQGDATWHFLGWHHFRHEPWLWPLGRIAAIGYPLGTSIGNTDSVPLLAFALKPFDAWLPELFQYFGPWLFACFVLQGGAAVLVLREVTRDRAAQLLGAALFVMAPPLLHRIEHAALTGHWLLLLGLWLTLAGRRRGPAWRTAGWTALCAVVGLVHPYLGAMVLALMIAGHATSAWHHGGAAAWRGAAADTALALAAFAVTAWQAGYFLVGRTENLAGSGVGLYSMNLVAPVMPMGGSTLLPDIAAATPGQYEGFVYFGAGWLLLTAIGVALLASRRTTAPRLGLAWVVAAALAVLALSPVITAGPRTIADWSAFAPAALGTFRATGRFGWVGMYVVFLSAITAITGGLPRRAALAVLTAALVVQAIDVNVYAYLRNRGQSAGSAPWPNPLQSPLWDAALPFYRHVVLAPPDMCAAVLPNPAAEYPAFSVAAGRHRATINSGFAARYDLDAVLAYCRSLDASLRHGEVADDTLYMMNPELRGALLATARAPMTCGQVDGYTVCVTAASFAGWRTAAERAGVSFSP